MVGAVDVVAEVRRLMLVLLAVECLYIARGRLHTVFKEVVLIAQDVIKQWDFVRPAAHICAVIQSSAGLGKVQTRPVPF